MSLLKNLHFFFFYIFYLFIAGESESRAIDRTRRGWIIFPIFLIHASPIGNWWYRHRGRLSRNDMPFREIGAWWRSKRARFAEPLRKHNSHFAPLPVPTSNLHPVTGRYVITQCLVVNRSANARRVMYYTEPKVLLFYIVAYSRLGAREIVRFIYTLLKISYFLKKIEHSFCKDRAKGFLLRCTVVDRPWTGPIFRKIKWYSSFHMFQIVSCVYSMSIYLTYISHLQLCCIGGSRVYWFWHSLHILFWKIPI